MTTITATATGYNGNHMTITTDNGLIITMDGDASLSNSVFPGWWGDVAEGEEYIAEWIEVGRDQDGNAYTVTWHFADVRGEEVDPDNYNWDNVERITSIMPR